MESHFAAGVPPLRVEYRAPELERPFGLLVTIADCSHSSSRSVTVTPPAKWRTFSRCRSDRNSLHLLAVGHLYANDATSFDVQESLKLLADAYSAAGVKGMQEAVAGGIFALIVIDEINRTIHAICDLLACMPLFYHRGRHGITLATNQLDMRGQCDVSRDACVEYLTYGYLPFSPSLFTGVERIGPGQILTVERPSAQCLESDHRLPTYPAPQDRIIDPSEACAKLDAAFSTFFSRVGDERLVAGLSGGYDSRLIAAYTRDRNRRLVTFGNPSTLEVETAEAVAAALGSSTQVFDIPGDAPSRCADDFIRGMQTLDSLEMSQVFGILDELTSRDEDYVLDGFLGGEVVGSHYFYSLLRGAEPPWRVLTATDRYLTPPQPSATYADRLASAYGRRLDLDGEARLDNEQVEARLMRMADEQLQVCHTDADMLELLSYRIRTRCVIACGPVTFLRRVSVLCPFYDKAVVTTCLSVAKALRAGDRLYNALWRRRFPECTHIPKESTGGTPHQSTFGYRATHFRNALWRRMKAQLGCGYAKAGGDVTDFVAMYCMSSQNRTLFKAALDSARDQLAAIGVRSWVEPSNSTSSLDMRRYLRLSSLALLLSS